MKAINLKIVPDQIHVLPSGGWLVCNKTLNSLSLRDVLLVQPDGTVNKIGVGLIKFSPSLNSYAVEYPESRNNWVVQWSELGNLETLKNNKFITPGESCHFSNGLFVCTGIQALQTAKEAEKLKFRHRRFYHGSFYRHRNIHLLFAAVPDFITDAFVRGGKHKKSVFFLRVATGESVSLNPKGLNELFDAFPSYDGLTALVVDRRGEGLIIDNPLES